MCRATLSYLIVLFAIAPPLQAQGPAQPERNAGPAPFQHFRQLDEAIELNCVVSRLVSEQRVRRIRTAEGQFKDEVYMVSKPVYEAKTLSTCAIYVDAFLPDGTSIEAAELGKKLAKRDVVAFYRLDQKPDSAYLELMKPDTLVVCIPDTADLLKVQAAKVGGEPDGAAPEPPRPAGGPAPAQPKPAVALARPGEPQRAQAVSAKINERGQFELRPSMPPADPADGKKAAAVEVIQAKAIRGYDLDGKLIDAKELASLLQRERKVLVMRHWDAPDPFYAKIMKPGTLILVRPRTDG